jgi:hypothetical protein
MKRFHAWGAALALVATAAAVPAQAHCWGEREVAAAQVREMQTLLMVAALRCRAAHMDFSAQYDGFVIAQHDALARANLVIKQHFAGAGGTQADYDRFTTSLANGFGGEATTEASCSEAAILAQDGSAAGPAALEPLAAARVFPVSLPGGNCPGPAAPVTMAMAQPPQPLPADVAQAMTVMARYGATQAAPAMMMTPQDSAMFAAIR